MVINLSLLIHLLSIEYDIFNDIINTIQLYISSKRYAVTCLCIKKSYFTRLTEIYYLCYNRDQKKYISIRQKQKYSNIHITNCPFAIVAKFQINSWIVI